MEPRRRRPESGCHPAAEPDDVRSGDPPYDDRSRARRGGAHGHRRRRRRRRALRDRARLPPVGRAAAERALAGRGCRRWAATRSSRACSRRCTRRSGSSSASSATRTRSCIRARPPRPSAGWLGELHPTLLEGTWGAFELDLETLFATVPERVVYEDVITYPADAPGHRRRRGRGRRGRRARRRRARGRGRAPARGARLRRLPRRPGRRGRKSVAIHLAFQSPERTLTEEEATDARELIVAALAERFGAELRAGRQSDLPLGRVDGSDEPDSPPSSPRCSRRVARRRVRRFGGARRRRPARRHRRSRLHDHPSRRVGRARHEARSRHVRDRGRRPVRGAQLPPLRPGRESRDGDRRDRHGDVDGHVRGRARIATSAIRTPGR